MLTEIKAPDGYVMDSPSTNVVIGTGGDTQTVVVKNSKAGSLVILKKSTDGKPLQGVEFKVTTSTGEFVPDASGRISSNGLYYTDKDGKITINGVVGTLVVTETKSIPGYTIDEATRTQTVDVRPNNTQTLYFYNKAATTVVIEKFIEGTNNQPLKGVTFLVTDSSGAVIGNSNGEFVTDEAGRIVLEGLEPGTTVTAREIKTVEGYELDGQPKSILVREGTVQAEKGWYEVVELKAAEGYRLDATPHRIEVKDGQQAVLEVTNRKAGSAIIHKVDSLTGEGIFGVTFLVSDSRGNPIGTYQSDNEGSQTEPSALPSPSSGPGTAGTGWV